MRFWTALKPHRPRSPPADTDGTESSWFFRNIRRSVRRASEPVNQRLNCVEGFEERSYRMPLFGQELGLLPIRRQDFLRLRFENIKKVPCSYQQIHFGNDLKRHSTKLAAMKRKRDRWQWTTYIRRSRMSLENFHAVRYRMLALAKARFRSGRSNMVSTYKGH